MGITTQISQDEFMFKVIGIIIIAAIFLLYLVIRKIWKGKRFILSGQFDEEVMLSRKEITIRDLQAGPWQINMQKSITYAGISLSSIILASVFIFEQKLQSYDAYMFNIILITAGFSVLSYFISLQFWFLALDIGGPDRIRVHYRRRATISQTAGWFTLMLSFVFSVTTINTYIGYFFCFLVALSLVTMYEYKAGMSLELEAENATKNDFQKNIDLNTIYVKEVEKELRKIDTVGELRILTWNIERGYNPKAIASYINDVRPDIVCLQEVDWGNSRTGMADVLADIARDTQMKGFFATEFYEIVTPYRGKRIGGGGVHGNAILTNISPDKYFRIELPSAFNWEDPPSSKRKIVKKEKRIGQRFAICLEFNRFGQKIYVCSAHLEDKDGGISGRYKQFTAIVEAIAKDADGYISVITGDLNTFESRLTSAFGFGDKNSRLGKPANVNECYWWKNHLAPKHGYVDPFSCDDWTFKRSVLYKAKLDYIFLHNCEAHERGIGDFNSSDHRPLWVEISLPPTKAEST